MFFDCPAYLDDEGAVRCGLPAEVRSRFTMSSTDGPLESVSIRCPSGHWFNAPVESLTLKGGEEHGQGTISSAGRVSLHGSPDGQRQLLIISQLITAALLPAGTGTRECGPHSRYCTAELDRELEDAEQELGAGGSHGHQAADSSAASLLLPKSGSPDGRPNGAPAYYLGRPASLWISVTSPRRNRSRSLHITNPTETPGRHHCRQPGMNALPVQRPLRRLGERSRDARNTCQSVITDDTSPATD